MKNKRKKAVLSVLLFFCISFIGFAQSSSESKELGYLIFEPNTAIFENEVEAKIILDQIKKSIDEISSNEKQIYINGFTAIFDNEIDPIKLSSDRANVVLNELISRGISSERFNVIKGNGGTNNWGNNYTSENRKPNRRVTISIDIINFLPVAETTIEPVTTDQKIEQITQLTKNQGKIKNPINWKKVAIIVAIIVAVIVITLLIIYVIIPALGAAGATGTGTVGGAGAKRLKELFGKTPIASGGYKGGYFGELPKIKGQERHHLITDTAIFNSKGYNPNGLNRGSSPAITMDKIDHRLLQSTGNTKTAEIFQTKQMELLNSGNVKEAFQMGVEEFKNAGLYDKYKPALEAAEKYFVETFTK